MMLASNRSESLIGKHARRLRILLVEDDHDNAESCKMLLELKGYEVLVSHDGLSGLAAAREFLPDVILLDIGLPGISGYEVAMRIRQETTVLRKVWLIALTAWCSPEDKKIAVEAGFDHHFAKPIEPESLFELLYQLNVN